VEFYKDIQMILQRSCVGCHSASNAAAGLPLDDANAYNQLANDPHAQWGIPAIISGRTWRKRL
jgi:hypothetical protein